MPATGTLQQAKALATNLDPNAILQQFSVPSARPLIKEIENLRQSRVVTLVYNESAGAMLTPSVFTPLESTLSRLGHVPTLDLFLISIGGMTEVPWRIVSLLREFTDKLGVIVPRKALSGATHISLGADDLVMTPFSCLGSVDPKLGHPLLSKDQNGNPIATSVQDLKHCIEFIRVQLGESATSQDLAQIISELFQHINPLAIGALEQSYKLSRLITEKVLRTRREPLKKEHIEKIVDTLAGRYFSHSFLISRAEVESDLGLPVIRPDIPLSTAISNLETHYVGQFGNIVQASPSSAEPLLRALFFLQTTAGCQVCAQVLNRNGQASGELMLDNQETQP